MADMTSQPAHPDIEVFREGSGEGSGAPLFCLPGYVGHAHFARLMLPYLSPAVPVLGVLAPSCEPDAAAPIERIAMACVERIRETQPRGPYRLLGYSLGGVVAHEVACQLQAQGERVESLVLLDSRAGLDAWADPSTSAGDVLQRALPRHCPGVFDGQVILFRSWSGPLRTLGLPGLGWEHLARQGVALFDVPTTHFGLVQPLAMASWGPVLGRLLDAHAGAALSDRTAPRAPHPDALVPWQPVSQLLRARRAALDVRWARVLACLLHVACTRAVVPIWAAEWVLRVAQSAWPWRLWQPISRGLAGRWMAGRAEWTLSAGRVRDTRCAPANPGRVDQDLSALSRHQRPETVLLAEAVLHRFQGDGEAATDCMDRLDRLIGDHDDLRVALVQQLEAIGWTEWAEQEASRTRDDAPAATVAQMCAERCLQARRRGDRLSAVREGQRAISLLPTVPHWYGMVIEALVSHGDREAAFELREQALERFPAQWGYRAELDRALGVSG
jgi:thioesterase domain-containing protein